MTKEALMKKIVTNSDMKQNLAAAARRFAPCLVAPAATAGLLLLVYAWFRLFPAGRLIFAWGDMTQQSIPLLLDLKNILSGEFDLFLNTANAGGMSFWGVFLFFLSSPFSFLIAFVESGDIYRFANVLVLLKMASAALTASLFFRIRFQRLTAPQQIALAMMYAFSGYALFYYQNLVWLDMLYMFPLLLLGFSRLLERRKIGLYVVTLTLTVTVNYYLSYMVVLFLILAMAVFLLVACDRNSRRQTAFLFSMASLLAALLSAVVWLPSLCQYFQSARTTGVLTSLANSDVFTSIPTVYPVILCTAITMAALPMCFLSGAFRSRHVKALFAVYVLLLIPVVLEPINKMWHIGSYQAFPVRYGYITVMLGLCLAASCASRSNERCRLLRPPAKTPVAFQVIAGCLLLMVGCVGLLLLVTRYTALTRYVGTLWSDYRAFWYSLIFAGLAALAYFFFLLLYHHHALSRRVFSIALCCMVLCEGLFYSSVLIGAGARSAWTCDNALALDHQIEEDGLYRTKLNRKYFDVNLVGALGYNTLSHYTSLTDEDYLYAMKKLGYSAYWMEVGSNGGTLLTDLLLANRYVIYTNTDVIPEGMSTVCKEIAYCIAENPAVDSFGVTFSAEDISALEKLPELSRMELQQSLSDLFYDCGQIVTPYTPERLENVTVEEEDGRTRISLPDEEDDGYLTYEIPVTGTQTLYFDCFDETSTALKEAINDSFDVTVNGVRKGTGYPSQKDNGLLELGAFTDETVEVLVKVNQAVEARSFGLFGLDTAALTEAAAAKTPTALTRSGNTISGTAVAEESGEYLLLPLIYDSGYTATVNGADAEVFQVFDAFLAVRLEGGENTITLTYLPRGFSAGLLLTALGGCAFAAALWAQRRLRGHRCRWLEWACYVLVIGLAVAVVLFVYIFPMIYCFIAA